MTDRATGNQGAAQLVVVGASAGGIDALLTLVEHLPADFPAPIVVAQHLDPNRLSHLGSLLANRTVLPVRTVTSHDPLQAGAIYVVPSDRDVEISDHHVEVLPRSARGPAPSIDRLLATAARVFADRLIAVILTGTGHDGTEGAKAVKAYGGAVIVQNPETARFPGMPMSVAPSTVDVVADLEAIGGLLVDLLSGAYLLPAEGDEDELRSFLAHVREQTGLDFAAYKRPTIARRLQRRMTAVGASTLLDYRRYIDRHPDELQRLVSTFLIKVTEFFRDPEFFAYLREQVLPGLIAEARERGELRIWSAGCATGEEAYSLAILVAELLGDGLGELPVRIFATDVAPGAVDFARHGVYPPSALAGVSREIIERYFVPINNGYEVRKTIRSIVIFGEHDLGHRAPFPRIDLILCRNVLIYFTPELQRRALQLFAFSLRRGGYLALGKSESVNPLPEYYALEQPRLKVFRRVGAPVVLPALNVLGTVAPGRPSSRVTRSLLPRLPRSSYDITQGAPTVQRADRLLDDIAIGVATVNRDSDVLAINTAARRLLDIRTSAIGEDLIHRVPPELAAPLRIGIDGALRGETMVTTLQRPPDLVDGEARHLLVTCSPLSALGEGDQAEVVLVQIIDETAATRERERLDGEHARLQAEYDELRARADAAIAALRELRSINQAMTMEQGQLRMEVELLQVAQEEAQAAAEEIETLNEELQATNEELETVNEELQATVEELQATVGELNTTNEELQARGIELESMTVTLEAQRQTVEAERSRLMAILANMGDAVLVVDPDGEVVLSNAAYDALFAEAGDFVPEDDAGDPLPEDLWPRRRASRGETFTMPFTRVDADGSRRWFESSGQPAQGSDGELLGVLVIRDITERSLRRQQEQFLAVAAHELRTPLAVLSGRLQLLLRRLAGDEIDQRLKEHATLALEQARRLEADVNELLDAARMQFGQLVLEREPLDLAALLRETVSMARPLAASQEIAVAIADAPVLVDGDKRRLQRVLLNLLTNAITYASETERIDVRLARAGSEAAIEVRDTGPGIPEEALEQIFSRFARGVAGRSEKGGLGLGLFIAREIVTAHGGTIEADSAPGKGTTMRIALPLATEQPPAAAND